MSEEEGEWDNYESGPFCQHWSDPSDCDQLCECGHQCHDHESWDEGKCKAEGCSCEKFTDNTEVKP